MENSKRLLLHIKALVWCLHRVCQKYNLEYIISSLKNKKLHPVISQTNLGANIQYIIQNVGEKDIDELIKCLSDVHQRRLKFDDILKDDDEIGYYIKSVKQIGDLPSDSYGVIIRKNHDFEAIFWNDTAGLMKKLIPKASFQIISGTYPE